MGASSTCSSPSGTSTASGGGATSKHSSTRTAAGAWTSPAGGFYVWVTLPEYLDTPTLLAAAVERKVAYVPGTAFYLDGRGRRQLRLSFSYPTPDRIEEGVRRLGELLADEEELFRSLSQ